MNTTQRSGRIFILVISTLLLVGLACGSTSNTTSRSTREPRRRTATDPTQSIQSTIEPSLEATSSPTFTSTPFIVAKLVLTSNVNIRSGPGTDYSVVAGAARGDTLDVFGKNADGTWLLIDPINYRWVFASLGTLDKDEDSIPLAPDPLPSPTSTEPPTKTPTRAPTRAPVYTITAIYESYKRMTELQFSEYKKEVTGKTVQEVVRVGNVSDTGNLIIAGDWSPILFNITDFCVVVIRVPKDLALSINGGEKIYLEATVNGIVGDYGYYFNCENALILNYKSIELE